MAVSTFRIGAWSETFSVAEVMRDIGKALPIGKIRPLDYSIFSWSKPIALKIPAVDGFVALYKPSRRRM